MPSESTTRVSARPKPLRALFSKYAPQAAGSPQLVRPLGVVRRPDSGESALNFTSEEELSDLERVYLYITGGGMDSNKVPYLSPAKCLAVLQSAKTQKNLPKLSKSQTFEQQYKLAVSRDGLSTPRISTKPKSKRLITLPMYQVKVNINTVEIEDSQAVESTRKSLRNLMEVGKIKASHPDNGVTANIKTFPFTNLVRSHYFGSSRSLQVRPSQTTKLNLESSVSTCNPSMIDTRNKELSDENFISNETHCSENKIASGAKSSYTQQTDDNSRTDTDFDRIDVRFESVVYTPTDVNKSPNSRAKTRESCMSKGDHTRGKRLQISPATRTSPNKPGNYLNRITPYNEQRASASKMYLRPATGGSHSLTSGEDWTNLKDIHKLKIEACRQASQARRRRRRNSKETAASPGSSDTANLKPCPTLRYTQLPRNLVPLDPIIVPSHTHIACPLCNSCDVPDTSSCPPNSPTDESEAGEGEVISDSKSTDQLFITVPCGDYYPDTRSELSTDVCDNKESVERLSNTTGDENQPTLECGRHPNNRPNTSSSQNSLYDVLIIPKVSMKYYPQ